MIDRATGRAEGRQSLLRIVPAHQCIEIGHIYWGPRIAGTRVATEAMYLFAVYALETLGYRRFEWKCDALNAPSRRAAKRFGFTYEGHFRRNVIIRDRSRDTAWFAMLAEEWSVLKPAYEKWLAPDNFDEQGPAEDKTERADMGGTFNVPGDIKRNGYWNARRVILTLRTSGVYPYTYRKHPRCLRANIKVQMCRACPLAASLSGLCSVAMREMIYSEVDLTNAMVDLVAQAQFSNRRIRAMRNRSITNHRTKNLTTESPTMYSTNESRSPKQYNPTRHYTQSPRTNCKVCLWTISLHIT